MGVDAYMAVEYYGPEPTKEFLAELSVGMADACGIYESYPEFRRSLLKHLGSRGPHRQVLDVGGLGRYEYIESISRGPLIWQYIMQAYFLEAHLPKAQVYYGPDTVSFPTGEYDANLVTVLPPFGPKERADYMDAWANSYYG